MFQKSNVSTLGIDLIPERDFPLKKKIALHYFIMLHIFKLS